MKKVVRINQQQLQEIVKKAVKAYLNEDRYPMSNGPIVVGRGRYKIYQKNNLAYVQDTQLTTQYTYYYNSQSWDRNAYPDFKGTSLEELERAGVKDAQGMFSSAQSLENSRLQSRQQQQQPKPQQPQPQQPPRQQSIGASYSDTSPENLLKAVKRGTFSQSQLGYLDGRQGAALLGNWLSSGKITKGDFDYAHKCIDRGH